ASTKDGPGERTTVFFKGCPLNCIWCHSPENISVSAEEIPSETTKELKKIGREWTIDELTERLLADQSTFMETGGGVTASGGEPTLQAPFVLELFKRMKAHNIHTALDTCGLTRMSTLDQLIPYTDLLLWDIKTVNPDEHERFTGLDNGAILNNLFEVAEKLRKSGGPKLWIRTPLIPGATANRNTVWEIASMIHEELADIIERWELCTYNNGGKATYEKLHIPWQMSGVELLTAAEVEELHETIHKFPNVDKLACFSGPLRSA
ncbi:hypothetical protein BVY04_01990, partial [bacterium M21]